MGGKECLEIGSGSGLYRRHKGMHAAVRVGWYNVKLRQSHGQEAQWSDEENEAPSDIEAELNEEDEIHSKKINDDLDDVATSTTFSKSRKTSDDSDSDEGDDEKDSGPKHGDQEEESDHDEEDAMPTLTACLSGQK